MKTCLHCKTKLTHKLQVYCSTHCRQMHKKLVASNGVEKVDVKEIEFYKRK